LWLVFQPFIRRLHAGLRLPRDIATRHHDIAFTFTKLAFSPHCRRRSVVFKHCRLFHAASQEKADAAAVQPDSRFSRLMAVVSRRRLSPAFSASAAEVSQQLAPDFRQ